MYPEQLEDLDLDEDNKIGYTFKTMGAGFWALNQKDFRKALTKITMEVIQFIYIYGVSYLSTFFVINFLFTESRAFSHYCKKYLKKLSDGSHEIPL